MPRDAQLAYIINQILIFTCNYRNTRRLHSTLFYKIKYVVHLSRYGVEASLGSFGQPTALGVGLERKLLNRR